MFNSSSSKDKTGVPTEKNLKSKPSQIWELRDEVKNWRVYDMKNGIHMLLEMLESSL